MTTSHFARAGLNFFFSSILPRALPWAAELQAFSLPPSNYRGAIGTPIRTLNRGHRDEGVPAPRSN